MNMNLIKIKQNGNLKKSIKNFYVEFENNFNLDRLINCTLFCYNKINKNKPDYDIHENIMFQTHIFKSTEKENIYQIEFWNHDKPLHLNYLNDDYKILLHCPHAKNFYYIENQENLNYTENAEIIEILNNYKNKDFTEILEILENLKNENLSEYSKITEKYKYEDKDLPELSKIYKKFFDIMNEESFKNNVGSYEDFWYKNYLNQYGFIRILGGYWCHGFKNLLDKNNLNDLMILNCSKHNIIKYFNDFEIREIDLDDKIEEPDKNNIEPLLIEKTIIDNNGEQITVQYFINDGCEHYIDKNNLNMYSYSQGQWKNTYLSKHYFNLLVDSNNFHNNK